MTYVMKRGPWTTSGGKVLLAKTLSAMLSKTPHTTYVEPFAGAAAVFFKKDRVDREVLGDTDAETVQALKDVQALTGDDISTMKGMDWTGARETYNSLLSADVEETDLTKRLHRFLYVSKFGFGSWRGKAFSPVAEGRVTRVAKSLEGAQDRLNGVEVLLSDYEGVVEKTDGEDTLFYFDPPYVGHNSLVGEEDFDEGRFHRTLKGLKGKFLATYGVKGEFPALALAEEGWTVKRIYPRRRLGGPGRWNSSTLATLVVTNYDVVQKALGDDLSDWVIEDGCDVGGDVFYPPGDASDVAEATPGETDLSLRIAKRHSLTSLEVIELSRRLVGYHAIDADHRRDALDDFKSHGSVISDNWVDTVVSKAAADVDAVDIGGGVLVPASPIVLKKNVLVADVDGTLAMSDAICGEAFPDAELRSVAGGHIPLYHLALVPAEDFGAPVRVSKRVAVFDFSPGETGAIAVRSLKTNSGESVVVAVSKRGESTWQGGVVSGGFDGFDGVVLIRAETTVAVFPGESAVSRHDLALLDPGTVVKKSAEGVESVEVASLVDAAFVVGEATGEAVELFTDLGRLVFVRVAKGLVAEQFPTPEDVVAMPESHFALVDGDKKSLPFRGADGEISPLLLVDSELKAPKGADLSVVEVEAVKTLRDARLSVDWSGDKTWCAFLTGERSKTAQEVTEPTFTILRKENDKRLVYGPVAIPELVDGHADIMSEDEVRKLAHSFMVNLVSGASSPGVMHADFARDLYIVESYTAPVDFVWEGRLVRQGTWIVCMKVLDDEVWGAVKDLQLRGFSYYAHAKGYRYKVEGSDGEEEAGSAEA